MNFYLLLSACLLIVLSIAHSIMGELIIIGPIQRSQQLPAVRGDIAFTKQTLRLTWHITALMGLGIASIMLYYATFEMLKMDQVFVLAFFGFTFVLCFFVAFAGSKAKHPAWIVFFLIMIFEWMGVMERVGA